MSWSSKKQNSVSLSTAEAEYIAAGSCCAQLLWMTQTLKDYGIHVRHVPLLCDNESAIKIAHNHVQHSRTKHIQVRHHFIRDHVAKGDINLKHVRTEKQLADIFTKPLDEKVFCHLRSELNIIDFTRWAFFFYLKLGPPTRVSHARKNIIYPNDKNLIFIICRSRICLVLSCSSNTT